jgi:ABC-type phosphate transport system permease subunit
MHRIRTLSTQGKVVLIFTVAAAIWWIYLVYSGVHQELTTTPSTSCLDDSFCAGVSNPISAFFMATIFALITTVPLACFLAVYLAIFTLYKKHKIVATTLALVVSLILIDRIRNFFAVPK